MSNVLLSVLYRDNVMIAVIVSAVTGYLIGCINLSYLIAKARGFDIREHGSGNAGASNVIITVGKKAGAFVAIFDVFKAFFAIKLMTALFPVVFLVGAITGVAVILGHIFPFYMGFKGGKGILVTFAAMLAINWIAGVVPFIIFAIVVAITRYVSLGSIIAATVYPFAVLVFSLMQGDSASWISFAFAAVIGAMLIFMHRANIQRLINHTEKKLGQKSGENEAAK